MHATYAVTVRQWVADWPDSLPLDPVGIRLAR